MQASSERLPWLNDEPPRGPARAAKRRTSGGFGMWPWYLLLLLLVGGVALGAWWLGTGKDAAPPVLPAEQSIPIPVNRPAPASDQAAAQQADVPPPDPDLAAPPPARPAPERRSTGPGNAEPQRARTGAREQRGVFPADEASAIPAPPQAGPAPIILYHPQPNRGRVIQLGAFPTRSQAEESWRKITRRYPYLATKPKLVNTVDVRALGGGRPTRMYRLQLGTSSQAQSVVICQQLERAGHSCVVVY